MEISNHVCGCFFYTKFRKCRERRKRQCQSVALHRIKT
nr:MAG TPA: hypothetical protein [Bacteriophage sp.]DAM50544.1 MAG TPA: hypothetical protein [Caudoviricetes sp.]DAG23656.1 MAG TPA: hypothetical protein [Bacteriophage sp.]DAM00459.1 MAG TPA: hypothetical protein [Bacteriophage sp.]DAR71961.1 MAG TPA: hypothetical protein [Caudoviricetes sp.]